MWPSIHVAAAEGGWIDHLIDRAIGWVGKWMGLLTAHMTYVQDAALWKEAMPAAAAVSEEGGEEASACWAPPRFKRAVIVVIDALRFDFVAPVDEGEEDGDDRDAAARAARARAKAKTAEMYHINKLPVVGAFGPLACSCVLALWTRPRPICRGTLLNPKYTPIQLTQTNPTTRCASSCAPTRPARCSTALRPTRPPPPCSGSRA